MVTINLSDEAAAALEARASEVGLELPEYVEQLAGVTKSMTTEQFDRQRWIERWHALVESMPGSDHGVDDSRESIYDDRV